MTTIDLQITDGAHDAQETAAGTSFSHIAVTLKHEASTSSSSRWNAGVYFPSVSVPSGAVIEENTYLSVVFPVSQRDSPDCDLKGELAANPSDFSVTTDVTSRTRTSATVNWSGTNLGSSPTFVNSPSIQTIVQEIVDQGGWASGNNMVFFGDGENATAQEDGSRWSPYDNAPSDATKLHIEYNLGRVWPLLRPNMQSIPIHQLQL